MKFMKSPTDGSGPFFLFIEECVGESNG